MTTAVAPAPGDECARHGLITARFMMVSTSLAQHWLDTTNTHNREVQQSAASTYERDMRLGAWRTDGMPLRFAGEYEVLLDGQNRLTAQVAAGIPLVWLVVAGLDIGDQDTMDRGKGRSFADVLKLRRVKNPKGVAAAVRGVWNYETFGTAVATSYSGRVPSNAELLAVLRANPRIPDYCIASPFVGISASMASTFLYLASRVDPVDAAEFIHLLRDGTGLSQGHPIYTLRTRLLRESQKTSGLLPSPVRWAFLVRTWIAWRGGERLTKLQFKPGGANPDRLPRIEEGGTSA